MSTMTVSRDLPSIASTSPADSSFANVSSASTSTKAHWAMSIGGALVVVIAWITGHAALGVGTTGTLTAWLVAYFLSLSVATDLQRRRIHNWTTYPGLIAAALLNIATEWSPLGSSLLGVPPLNIDTVSAWGGIGWSACWQGALISFSALFLFFLLFGGGAGDVKLMAMLGAFLGFTTAAEIWLAAMLSASLFTLGYLAFQLGATRLLRPLLSVLASCVGSVPLMLSAHDAEDCHRVLQHRLPLAPFFAVGTVVVLQLHAQQQTLFSLW
jgi:prepilin peptidase CpaA